MTNFTPVRPVALVVYEDATIDQLAQSVTVGFLLQVLTNLQTAVASVSLSLPAAEPLEEEDPNVG